MDIQITMPLESFVLLLKGIGATNEKQRMNVGFTQTQAIEASRVFHEFFTNPKIKKAYESLK